jgi:hypothetical protein
MSMRPRGVDVRRPRGWAVGVLLVAMAMATPCDAQEPGQGLLSRDAALLAEGGLVPADLEALASADLPGVRRYLERRGAFRSRLVQAEDERATQTVPPSRVAIERAIVSLVDRPGIEASAADVAAALALTGSAERDAAALTRETASAEAYLQSHSDTPAVPYLYAFLASRYRMALESAAERGEKERLARRYRTMLDRLRGQADPIFTTLARDLDGVPSMLGQRAEHPRDYLPPG